MLSIRQILDHTVVRQDHNYRLLQTILICIPQIHNLAEVIASISQTMQKPSGNETNNECN